MAGGLSRDATLSDHGSDIIPPGTGFVVRKAAGGLSAFWTNAFPVSAISVVSRKVHGNGVGALDINLPASGAPGTECRIGGASQAIFTFPAAVTINTALGTGGAKVTSGTGTHWQRYRQRHDNCDGRSYRSNQRAMDHAYFDRSQRGVNTNDVAVRVGNLIGDTTGDRSINVADVGQTKSQSGHAVTTSNFREDVTTDGSINVADIGLVKRKSGTTLP